MVRRDRAGRVADAIPATANARNAVYEYGGGSYTVAGGDVFYTDFGDQRVWIAPAGGGPARPTHRSGSLAVRRPDDRSGAAPALRHSGGSLDQAGADPPRGGDRSRCGGIRRAARGAGRRRRLLCVAGAERRRIGAGLDLVAASRHAVGPNRALGRGRPPRRDARPARARRGRRRVAGGENLESIREPRFSPSGALCFVSDRTGYWNLYRRDGEDRVTRAHRAGGRGRRAAVGVRRVVLRLRRRRRPRAGGQPRRDLAAAPPALRRARGDDRSIHRRPLRADRRRAGGLRRRLAGRALFGGLDGAERRRLRDSRRDPAAVVRGRDRPGLSVAAARDRASRPPAAIGPTASSTRRRTPSSRGRPASGRR